MEGYEKLDVLLTKILRKDFRSLLPFNTTKLKYNNTRLYKY